MTAPNPDPLTPPEFIEARKFSVDEVVRAFFSGDVYRRGRRDGLVRGIVIGLIVALAVVVAVGWVR